MAIRAAGLIDQLARVGSRWTISGTPRLFPGGPTGPTHRPRTSKRSWRRSKRRPSASPTPWLSGALDWMAFYATRVHSAALAGDQ
jgi:hypothetical protein